MTVDEMFIECIPHRWTRLNLPYLGDKQIETKFAIVYNCNIPVLNLKRVTRLRMRYCRISC